MSLLTLASFVSTDVTDMRCDIDQVPLVFKTDPPEELHVAPLRMNGQPAAIVGGDVTDVHVHAARDFHAAQLAEVRTTERLTWSASVEVLRMLTNFEGQSADTARCPLCPFRKWSVRTMRQKMTWREATISHLTNDHAPTSAKDVGERTPSFI